MSSVDQSWKDAEDKKTWMLQKWVEERIKLLTEYEKSKKEHLDNQERTLCEYRNKFQKSGSQKDSGQYVYDEKEAEQVINDAKKTYNSKMEKLDEDYRNRLAEMEKKYIDNLSNYKSDGGNK